jgi:hypothetical protein
MEGKWEEMRNYYKVLVGQKRPLGRSGPRLEDDSKIFFEK